MKKILSLLVILTVLISASSTLAEGMAVQIIGGPTMESDAVSLDDFMLDTEVPIDGYGILLGTSFEYVDKLGYYGEGSNFGGDGSYNSGADAEYALLRMDITNTALKAHNFLSACEVKVIYDDLYEYAGWFHQYNYNNPPGYGHNWNITNVIHANDRFTVEPMYTGHYCFGCTLPNAVVDSKAPLQMIITIDDNEITYNIRK